MTRQVFELAGTDDNYVKGHITSLNPIRKENAPDSWERSALKSFEAGMKEVSSLQVMDGQEYMRLMRPFLVEQQCLKCHAAQGYVLGDIRGGISVSVPMAVYSVDVNSLEITRIAVFSAIWLFGMGLIVFGSRNLSRNVSLLCEKNIQLGDEIVEREASQTQLQEQTVMLEEEIAERQRTEEQLDLKTRVLEKEIAIRIQSEMALRNSEISLQNAQAAAHMGSWTWDIKNNRLEWSREMYHIFGIDRASCAGTIAEVHRMAIHPEDRHIVEEARRAIIEEGKTAPVEYRVIWPDNTEHVIWEEAGDRLLDERGNLVSLSGFAQDISERRKIQTENLQLEAQLQQAQKLESIGRLAGGVAHDFNNMLTVITGFSHLGIMESDPSTAISFYFYEIRKTAERSADLTRQLLAFARKQTITPKILDLNKTVAGMLKMLHRLIGEEVKLNWRPDADLWNVRMDPSQIDQMLANLCVNARDAIATVGNISIETGNRSIDEAYCCTHAEAVPGEYVCIAVSDDGHGMDSETVAHIFEPFFTTKGVGEGTGLGLATIYGIVKQNNGFVDVCSEPGLGTTFSVYIPRYEGAASQLRTEEMSAALKGGYETILLVEDEPAILDMTTTILGKQGYTVLPAKTPREAIRLAHDHAGEISLLITDVVMPEMSGRDLADTLLSLYPDMKHLFMSGYTADIIANHGVLDETINFIQKPFSLPDMATKVRNILDTPPAR
jgi:PAS domain S-box-containing protein